MNGRLVDPRSPEQLADSIIYLAENPDQAEMMRQASYERFLSGYTKDHMVNIAMQACAEIWPYLPDAKGGSIAAAQGSSQTAQ